MTIEAKINDILNQLEFVTGAIDGDTEREAGAASILRGIADQVRALIDPVTELERAAKA